MEPPTQKTLPYNQTYSGSDNQLRRYRWFFRAHEHFRHISTSGGSYSDGFRTHTYMSYSSSTVCVWLSFLAVSMGHSDDRRRVRVFGFNVAASLVHSCDVMSDDDRRQTNDSVA